MKIIVLLLVVSSVVMATQLSVEEQWNDFKEAHGKAYENEEEEGKRRAIFETNLQKIEEHNKKYDNGEVTWKMGINKFADLTPDEMKQFTAARKRQPADLSTVA